MILLSDFRVTLLHQIEVREDSRFIYKATNDQFDHHLFTLPLRFLNVGAAQIIGPQTIGRVWNFVGVGSSVRRQELLRHRR